MAFRKALLAALLLAVVTDSHAGALRVAPIRIDLPLGRRAAAVTITNTGSNTTLLQIEVRRWSQATGKDDYASTDQLVVSPPIFSLDAGAEQVVRIAQRAGSEPLQEQAYRLFIKEVPTPVQPAARELNVVLEIGVPAFLTPKSAPRSELVWKLVCSHDAPPTLRLANPGGRALRIDELTLRTDAGDLVERAVYVLSGATRVLPLWETLRGARKVDLRARSGEREIQGAADCD